MIIFKVVTGIIIAVFLLFFTCIVSTSNTRSLIFFKFLPVILAILQIIVVLFDLGFLVP